MDESTQLDAEAKLAENHEGTYKAQLIETLVKHRDDIAFQQQGFLSPDEYETVENMAKAVDAALIVIGAYKPKPGSGEVSTNDNDSGDIGSASMIHF